MMVRLARHERLQMLCILAMVVWMNGGQMSSLASSSMASRSPTLSSLASGSPTLSSLASLTPTLSPSSASSSSSPTSLVASLTPTLSPSRVTLSSSDQTLKTTLPSSNQTLSASSASSSSSSSSGKRGRRYEEEENAQATAIPADLQRLEAGFTKWVQYIGSLRHSVFGVAQNQELPRSTLLVDKRPGAGHFSSIQAAIDSVPEMNVRRVRIFIAPGTYTEKVFIPYTKPFITIQGTNSTNTIIQWGDTADKKGAGGNPLGTFNSATVAVEAPYFIAKNITFKNTAPRPIPGSKNQQAVALRISGDAAVFQGCQFLGAQDTLYDHKGRHFFQDCYVEGSVDFIFGDGLSMYKGCHLHAIGAPYEALTAQNRNDPQDDSGFSFVNCKVTGSGPLYLGRAWGTFSRVVYSYTFMDSIIVPKGWYDWGDPKRELTVYYGQYKCFGPGANNTGRVTWSKELTTQEAHPFLDLSFIDGTEWVVD